MSQKVTVSKKIASKSNNNLISSNKVDEVQLLFNSLTKSTKNMLSVS